MPVLPRYVFRAQTAAWTAAGWRSPATINPLPRFARRSLASDVDPARIDTSDAGSRQARGSGRGRSKACGKGRKEGSNLPALETEPMIRHGSRQRVDPFDGVQPVHCAAGHSRTPSVREASRVADHLRVGQERVGVERENHRGSIEPEHEIEVAPRGRPQAGEPVLVADGIVGRPLQPWVAGAELGGQARESG